MHCSPRRDHQCDIRRALASAVSALLFCGFCISPTKGSEAAPKFLWAESFASTVDALPYGFALDASGNSYCTGTFRDELRVAGLVLTNGGVFIIKADRNGRALWARQEGAETRQGIKVGVTSTGQAIGVDGAGNVYVLCRLDATTSLPIAGTNLQAHFVMAKYTPDGTPVWARPLTSGTVQADAISAMAVNPLGANYWAVFFNGNLAIGATNVSGTWVGALVKCDPEGNVVWVKSPPAGSFTSLAEPALDANGDLYVAGRFNGTIQFATTNLTSFGASDVILTKWTPAGQLLWARQAGGAGSDDSLRLEIDAAGDCLISGTVVTPAAFGGLALTNATGEMHSFIAKYTAAGEILWVRSAATGSGRVNVTTDSQLNCYVAATKAFTNVYYAKYNSAGELLWSRTLAHDARVFDFRADAMGHCYVYGWSATTFVSFDDITLTCTNGHENAFLAKLDTTTRPRLNIGSLSNAVHVTWPALASGYYLETTRLPTAPESWASNTTEVTSTGLVNTVTFPVSDKLFYRLRR